MHYDLPTIVNKFNGNFCFAGRTDLSYSIIFECDHINNVMSYDYTSKTITGICLNDSASYLVAFGDNWIGKFESGSLNENCFYMGSNVHQIIKDRNQHYYILNRTTNQLSKYINYISCKDNVSSSSSSLSESSSSSSSHAFYAWTFDLPDYDYRHYGSIVLRESDGMIIYCNNNSIYYIRDDNYNAVLINVVSIGTGDKTIRVALTDEFSPSYTYARVRTLEGTILGQSSSSSTSSKSSSSSSSSKSSSSSSSIDSSSTSSSLSSSSSNRDSSSTSSTLSHSSHSSSSLDSSSSQSLSSTSSRSSRSSISSESSSG